MPSTLPAPIDKLAIVVVTYKRQELLANLFDSMTELTAAPWRIVIVDNENSRETEAMCTAFNERLANLWGTDIEQPDAKGGTDRVIYAPQLENGGGAGGFSAGTKCAYDLGAQWFWVMDDDVLVIPEGIERLAKWTDRYDVIQGSRLDFDGGAFFWQYQLILSLGIPNPIAKWDLGPEGYRAMNQLCFEGGMFSRRVVDKIGLPDARFFIYGDDACYGYVASQHFPAAVVADVVLKRARAVSNWDIAGKRQLNSTSDTNRYYIMRNRGYWRATCRSTATTTPRCSVWATPRPSARSSFAWPPLTSALRPDSGAAPWHEGRPQDRQGPQLEAHAAPEGHRVT